MTGDTHKPVFTFKRTYFGWAIFLLIVEIIIALYVHDGFIRPYIGDLLVVIWLYCLVRAFINIRYRHAAISVLAFSYLVETLQYFQFIKILGLQHSKLARVIIGTSFAWADILAYTAGIVMVIAIEQWRKMKRAMANAAEQQN